MEKPIVMIKMNRMEPMARMYLDARWLMKCMKHWSRMKELPGGILHVKRVIKCMIIGIKSRVDLGTFFSFNFDELFLYIHIVHYRLVSFYLFSFWI